MGHQPRNATTLTDISRNSTINVESINVFDDVRVGDVVTPVDGTKYNFTKEIDLGAIRFVIAPGSGVEFSSDNLISNTMVSTGLTGAEALFSGDSGRLIIRDIDITMSGGVLFDIDATTDPAPLVQVQNGIFTGLGVASLGTVKGALVIWRTSGIFGWSAGIMCDDNGILENVGVQFLNNLIVAIPGTQITIDGDQSLIDVNANITTPNSGGYFLDLASDIVKIMGAEVDTINILNNTVDTQLGGAFLAPGGLDSTSLGVMFFNNNSELDSYWTGSLGFEDNLTVSPVEFQDTYYDIVGTIAAGADNERFSVDGDEITHEGMRPIRVSITVDLSLRRDSPATATKVIRTQVLVNNVKLGSAAMAMSGMPRAYSFTRVTTLVKGDVIKAQYKNESGIEDIVATDYNLTINKL